MRSYFSWSIQPLLAVLLLLAPVSSNANEEGAAVSRLQWKRVEVGGIGILSDGGFSGSAVLRYSPKFALSAEWRLGVSADVSYHLLDTGNRFVMATFLANIEYFLDEQMSVEWGAGVQTWGCSACGASFVTGPVFRYRPKFISAEFIEDFWGQYLFAVRAPAAHELLIGVTLNLF